MKPAHLPGPPQHWFFGSARELSRDPLRFYGENKERFGDLFAMRFLNQRCVVASGLEAIEQVLISGAKSYRKHFVVRFLMPVFGNGLFTSEGDFWRKQRKLIQPAFHRGKITRFGETMVDYAEATAGEMRPGEIRDVHADLSRLTLLIACKTLFDADVRGQASEVAVALEHLQDATTEFIDQKIPLPAWVPTRARRHLLASVAMLDRIVYRILAERRGAGVEREDLLSLLLAMRDDEGEPMPDRQLRDEVVTLFIGGFETTSIGLSWALHVLATQPGIDRQVREELAREVGARRVTVEDLPRLVVLDAFVKETLRLHSPAWVIGREATEPTEICGHPIAAGTSVVVPIQHIHRDARWYRDPERFRMERWLGEEAKTIPKLAWIPFGAGPRVCIGEGFARMEMSLLLATLLRRLRFEPVGEPPTPRPAFLLRPKQGVRLKVGAA